MIIVVQMRSRFFVRLRKKLAGILSYVKSFLRDMAEKLQVAVRQRRQPLIVRCCLKGNMTAKGIVQRNGIGF